MFTAKQKKQIESLVVSYHAYHDAVREWQEQENIKTVTSVCVWAKMLIEDQEKMGITLASNVYDILEDANEAYKKLKG